MSEDSGIVPKENPGFTSSFRFLSYKIDFVDLKFQRSVEMLETTQFEFNWTINFALRKPLYYSKRKVYVCGIECGMSYPSIEEIEKNGLPEMINLKGGIAGIFKAEEGQIAPQMETALVKVQAPAILLPYIRGAMTSLLANSGVGSVIFPLVNMHEIAKSTLKDEPITIRDA